MKAFMIFIFLLFAMANVRGNDCSPVDLRSENMGVARDQGKVSWCYAFATSDFLNFYNPGKIPSAAAVAALYNTHQLPKTMHSFLNWFYQITNNPKARLPFQTGFSKIAAELSLEEGLCDESDFPSTSWKKVSLRTNTISEEKLDQVMKDIFEMKRQTLKGKTLSDIGFTYELPNVNQKDFFEVVRNFPINEIFNELRILSCTPRGLVSLNLKMSLKKKKILDELDVKLDLNEPVMIDYSSEILKDKNFRKLLGSLHTSLIVGRRFNQLKDRCEYLIKNSYGEDCSEYDQDYTCEKGFVWLPSQELYRSMTSIVYAK